MITLPKDPKTLLAWDRPALLDRVMDDEVVADMIVSDFLDTIPQDLIGFQAALAVKDVETMLKHVHRINGAAGNVGAIRLYALAYDTEVALHKHLDLDLVARFKMLEEAFAAFLEAFTVRQEARP